MSVIEYVMGKLRERLPEVAHKIYIADVTAGTEVRFGEVEELTRRAAAGLRRLGFKRGDVLYFVTNEMAHLAVLQLAVWRLGGAVRGCVQQTPTEEFVRQMVEVEARFVLVDSLTVARVLPAVQQLGWPVSLLSVGSGRLEGATHYQDLIAQDEPDTVPVSVFPREDVILIPNTSGSTGLPKGVLHTHFSTIAGLCSMQYSMPEDGSLIEGMVTCGIGSVLFLLYSLKSGVTLLHIGKFERETYFDLLMEHKPEQILLYPYLLAWFTRQDLSQLGFVRQIWVGGWMLDPTTLRMLEDKLSHAKIIQVYGISELWFVSATEATGRGGPPMAVVTYQGREIVSAGKLLPGNQAKIADVASGEILGRNQLGEILIRSPGLMKDYLQAGGSIKEPDLSDVVDSDGFFKTGDMGFFDDEGNIYVCERKSFMFKYCMRPVSPSEIEAVLSEHVAVQEAGVSGVPNQSTDSLATALVVLKPHLQESDSLRKELLDHVASRLPDHKQLHGGLHFVTSLPAGPGGKLDRRTLLKQTLALVSKYQ